jgi:hypothetical protein
MCPPPHLKRDLERGQARLSRVEPRLLGFRAGPQPAHLPLSLVQVKLVKCFRV